MTVPDTRELDDLASDIVTQPVAAATPLETIQNRGRSRRRRRRGLYCSLGAIAALTAAGTIAATFGLGETRDTSLVATESSAGEPTVAAQTPTRIEPTPAGGSDLYMPNVGGLERSEAESVLAALGISFRVEQIGLGATATEIVAFAEPTVGTALADGDTVVLFVAPGATADNRTVTPVEVVVLAEDFGGESFSTAVATTQDELDALADRLGLAPSDVASVDLDSSVILYFGTVASPSCPLEPSRRLLFDASDGWLYPHTQYVGSEDPERTCPAVAVPRGLLVAVDRWHFPDGPVSLWVGPDRAQCCPDGVTTISLTS